MARKGHAKYRCVHCRPIYVMATVDSAEEYRVDRFQFFCGGEWRFTSSVFFWKAAVVRHREGNRKKPRCRWGAELGARFPWLPLSASFFWVKKENRRDKGDGRLRRESVLGFKSTFLLAISFILVG